MASHVQYVSSYFVELLAHMHCNTIQADHTYVLLFAVPSLYMLILHYPTLKFANCIRLAPYVALHYARTTRFTFALRACNACMQVEAAFPLQPQHQPLGACDSRAKQLTLTSAPETTSLRHAGYMNMGRRDLVPYGPQENETGHLDTEHGEICRCQALPQQSGLHTLQVLSVLFPGQPPAGCFCFGSGQLVWTEARCRRPRPSRRRRARPPWLREFRRK